MEPSGYVSWVSGPVVRARITGELRMLEQVQVGRHLLVGEVIGLRDDVATIQVYEETSGLVPGDIVVGLGRPISVELGPGLIGGVFDGIQRPLEALAEQSGDFIGRGVAAPALDRQRRWGFIPQVQVGNVVSGGTVLGKVPETELVEHRVLVPIGITGEISWVASEGEYRVEEPVARVRSADGERELTMLQRWAVRDHRPVAGRLSPTQPLITGQRVIDTLFPISRGGAAAVPGGFGAGKTVLQHALAKWSDADIVIYIGCGERGNEMTDVLIEFPRLQDPATGRPLMERTILIANTSNMPMAAREASIYTGISLAEYYRDMGYHVALMADSTSRWAEALREISGRLEEMPAEEGFPAYLASRLASFYERAGRVTTLSGREGSVTVVGAVSPPGGDFSEPVTQHTQRFVRTFWALDKSLAAARHFPAVSWLDSYSGYVDDIASWWADNVSPEWQTMRARVLEILQREVELQEIVRLVGADALPDMQRFTLLVARMIKEAFLQQNALDPVDAYSTPVKQVALLHALLHLHERGVAILRKGAPVGRIRDEVTVWPDLVRAKSTIPNEEVDRVQDLVRRLDEELDAIESDYDTP
ncbi:MAG: V-type ATP synthase subunit A [Anaerolineae bacterium]|jgi:V/A-type H+-transporting ATPase subunit A